jgi:N-methylhydantoinase B
MPLDPITTEILWSRLVSVADEQAKALFRGSFSTAVGESEDFASTVHDADGRMIVQSVSTGTISMLTGIVRSIQLLAQQFAGSLEPGDAIICNDPWMFSGHKWDVTLASPVFQGEKLVAWTATCLHAADIGGIGFSSASRDTYDEGLLIPPTKLMKAGRPNEELFSIIRGNVRMPAQVLGDFQAQVAANEVGGAKMLELLAEYGLDSLEEISREITDRSEQAMRAAIKALPDGSHTHAVKMDGVDQPITINACLTVDGDEIVVDFTGSSPQIARGFNGVWNVTYGWTAHAIKSALVPEIPNNDGLFRPLRVIAPEGTIVNARFPAPTAARHLLYMFLSAAVFGALSRIVPERVTAESGVLALPSIHSTTDDGLPFEYWFLVNTGMGATPLQDGSSGTSWPANVAGPSVEIVENVSPVQVLSKRFVKDSGGPGRYRGGCDQEVRFRVRSGRETTLACMIDRAKFPAAGQFGGGAGGLGGVLLNDKPVATKGTYAIGPDDVVTVSGGGGGGFFPAWERSESSVIADVENELISAKAAEHDYGVFANWKSKTVDRIATDQRRAELRQQSQAKSKTT